MSYSENWIEQALPILFMPEMTVQVAREEGMPGGDTDPRNSINGVVSMIDLRIAWEQCSWLTPEHRQAALAYALAGTERMAEHLTGVPHSTIRKRRLLAYEILAQWLNSSRADREAWERELDAAR